MRSKLIDKRREMMEDYAQFARSAIATALYVPNKSHFGKVMECRRTTCSFRQSPINRLRQAELTKRRVLMPYSNNISKKKLLAWLV